ncbi:phosphatidate cytidylyltransferase [Roseateles toxinivorans]|uniref:Phosphatidate cytidylyltransferase n=1 Tax=Roseateles toxinivorans TaxID=270368 RepID=A0A4R6QL83_9BURK|nr:phosphatidate cytidylyltransferase [Roseateles toxinivorans]TDP63432.1 phosphatidate cytidylyltransferase [Roseateles toxinivorans]
MSMLKDLSVDQQVGLLFVILFGVLLLVSVGAFLRTLREREQTAEQQEWQHEFRRDLRAVWGGAVIFWGAWISGPIGATLLFGVFSFLALREFITLMHTRRSDHRSLLLAFFVLLPVQYVLVGTRHFDLFTVFLPVYGFLGLPVISALADDPERFLERNAKIQWGIMLCVYGLSHAPALLLLDFPNYKGRGAFLLFFLVMVAGTAQIGQELASRWLRRRPLARRISRSFSVRAWLIGAVSAAIVGMLLYWITPFKAGQALVMAFIAAGAGTLGGLVLKALKRDAGVRYWGNRSSITGAAGLLDRIAVLCFAAPVFFHSVRWYFSLSK